MPRTQTRLPARNDDAIDVAFDCGDGRDRVGTVVDDRYQIVDVIGVGGMGVVYRAEHVYIRRTVALKILERKVAGVPQLAERFEREAMAIGRLDHPNCVSVLDFGHLPDGSYYLTMPFLEGPSLGELLQEGRLPVRRALRIARHVASALAHIHKSGIVHRDLKPENIIIVDREGDPDFATLLDFGIAKLLPRDDGKDETEPSDLTLAGQRFGTPAYMSPEQAVGGSLDLRADLYSLCVVLYQMLCGKRPFDHDDPVRLMEMQERAPLPRMADLARGVVVPKDVEALVRRGLEKDPNARWADAMELVAAIDNCLETGQRGARPPWRRPRWIAAAVLVVAAAAAVAVLLWPEPTGESHVAARARALIAQGKPTQAIAYLEGNPALAGHADTNLQLGHAYASSGRQVDAVTAYRRALSKDDGLAGDENLVRNLRLMVGGSDVEIASAAADLLLSEIDDGPTSHRVVAMAGDHDKLAWRARMRQLAEQHGLAERVDWRASYTLDLEQARSCSARRDAIVRLRSVGDSGAIPAIAAVRDNPDNDCLRDAADDAIAFLRGRKADDAATADD